MDAGEVVGVQVVFVESTLNGVIKLGKVIVVDNFVKVSQLFEITLLLLSQVVTCRQPIFNSGECTIQSLDGIVHMNNQLLHFLSLQSA